MIEPKHVGRLKAFSIGALYGGTVYWSDDVDKILANDQELILEQRDKINKLKSKVNQLQQKLGAKSETDILLSGANGKRLRESIGQMDSLVEANNIKRVTQ